jgi:hypothetical protein
VNATNAAIAAAFGLFFPNVASPAMDGARAHDSTGLTLAVEFYNKERTVRICETRAGDSVVLCIIPRKINGEAFIAAIDSVTVELLSGFALLAREEPAQALGYPGGIPGPIDNYALFTRLPVRNTETARVSGRWSDRVTGRQEFISGEARIRVRPGPPEKVVFINPGSNSKGLTPTRVVPGIAYACTLVVFDRFGNRAGGPVRVVARSLMPDLAVVVGGSPDLVLLTDPSGVGAFIVQLTNQAKTNDVVRLEAEIVDDSASGSRKAKAALAWRMEQTAYAKCPHHPEKITEMAYFSLEGRIVPKRLAPETIVCRGKKFVRVLKNQVLR